MTAPGASAAAGGRASPPPPGGKASKESGTSLSNVLSSSKSSLATISFQPRAAAPAFHTRVAEAPVFVPRGAPVTPAAAPTAPALDARATTPATNGAGAAAAPPYGPAPGADDAPGGPYDGYYDARAEERAVRHPLHYHLCAPPLPHVSALHPTHAALSFFMDPALHETLHHRQEALYAAAPRADVASALPTAVHVYHGLVPLEGGRSAVPASLLDLRFRAPGAAPYTSAPGDPSRVFGHRMHLYKATCALDGKSYVLRRFEGVQPPPAAVSAAERWRKLRHPALVSLREAFTTRAFGDHSLVLVYDFHPLATTLYMEHMVVKPLQADRRTGRLQPASMHVPERVLWSYACQLASLLRVVHDAGLAARCLEPSKVLCTGQHRVRLNACAVWDVLGYQAAAPPGAAATHQAEDWQALGRLLLCVACHSAAAAATDAVAASLAQVRKGYSAALHGFLETLLAPRDSAHADDVWAVLAPHLADELGSALHQPDVLEASLMRELENGRLVRLLCKLQMVWENPALERDTPWSETGEKYVLGLFRDMVFHAVTEQGRPALDLSHVLVHLNKLDAGIDETLMLTSRDELTCVMVTYAELKKYIEGAWSALARA